MAARLQAKMERQIQLLVAGGDSAAADAVGAEIRQATTEYQQLEAKILTASPRYANFAKQDPLKLAAGCSTNIWIPDRCFWNTRPGSSAASSGPFPEPAFEVTFCPADPRWMRSPNGRARASAAPPIRSLPNPRRDLKALSRAVLGPLAARIGNQAALDCHFRLPCNSFRSARFRRRQNPRRTADRQSRDRESSLGFHHRFPAAKQRCQEKLEAGGRYCRPGFRRRRSAGNRIIPQPATRARIRKPEREVSVLAPTTFDRLTFTRREAENILALAPPAQHFRHLTLMPAAPPCRAARCAIINMSTSRRMDW